MIVGSSLDFDASSESEQHSPGMLDNHDVVNALKAWEPAQLAYGNQLLVHGQMLGDRSQFSYGSRREA